MKKPKIRFKGFTETWEQRKLEDFGVATGGTSIESEFIEDGKYKVISIGSYSECSKYVDQGIRTEKTPKTKNRILNKNDLAMILNDKTSSGKIIGRVLLIDADDAYVYNQRTERIEVNHNCYVSEFLYHLLNADNIRAKIIRTAQGNTQIYVNWNVIKNFTYDIPINICEQIVIGDCFSKLDDLITLHQRKCENLKKLKKFMLQKMFPQNGENVPKIRFYNFTDTWEQRKLDEVITRIGTGLNPRDNFTLNSGGENYYVTIKNFVHGHLSLDDNCDKVDDEALKRIQERSDLCVNDILFTSIGRIGDCYLIKKQPTNWNINESVFTLRPNLTLVEPEYIYHTIHSDAVLNQIINGITGSTFKSIKIADLKKVNIPVPSKAEQKQIAAFISIIDHLITLHQSKCDNLKELKKYMLQNMFI